MLVIIHLALTMINTNMAALRKGQKGTTPTNSMTSNSVDEEITGELNKTEEV
jgi:hypothetical protein